METWRGLGGDWLWGSWGGPCAALPSSCLTWDAPAAPCPPPAPTAPFSLCTPVASGAPGCCCPRKPAQNPQHSAVNPGGSHLLAMPKGRGANLTTAAPWSSCGLPLKGSKAAQQVCCGRGRPTDEQRPVTLLAFTLILHK